MVCNSLEEVRTNIDRINNEIVKLIAERGTYVVQASTFKTEKIVNNKTIDLSSFFIRAKKDTTMRFGIKECLSPVEVLVGITARKNKVTLQQFLLIRILTREVSEDYQKIEINFGESVCSWNGIQHYMTKSMIL